MMSALLDLLFCLFWLEQDVLAPDEVKSKVEEMIIGGYKFTPFPSTLCVTNINKILFGLTSY